MEMGLAHLWSQMSFLPRAVVIILLFLSIWSMYVMIERTLVYRKARKESLEFAKKASVLFAQDRPEEVIELARKSKWSYVARVTKAGSDSDGLRKDEHAGVGHDSIEAGERAIEREALMTSAEMKKGLGNLATISTTAPFIGLFGTVIGIITAFPGMALTGWAVSRRVRRYRRGPRRHGARPLRGRSRGVDVQLLPQGKLERFNVEMSNSASQLIDFFIKKQAGTPTRPPAGRRIRRVRAE